MRWRSLWCGAAALLLLAAWLLMRLYPDDATVPEIYNPHAQNAYLTRFEDTSQIEKLVFHSRDGETFSLRPDTSQEGYDAEAIRETVICASVLPPLDTLGVFDDAGKLKDGGAAADFGLEPPLMRIEIKGGKTVTLDIGDLNREQTAYYARVAGVLYLIDAESGDLLTRPQNAYRERKLWPGEPDDRPAVTRISVNKGGNAYEIERIPGDEGVLGYSYRIVKPFVFACNNEVIRQKVLSDVLGIDLDEFVAESGDYGFEGDTLLIEGEGYSISLGVGAEAPGGGRYLLHDGCVYLDRLGGYDFMSLSAEDLAYGTAFWLYAIDDVAAVTVSEDVRQWRFETNNGEYKLKPPGEGGWIEVKELNARRFFARVLNFSVAGPGVKDDAGVQMSVRLEMADGSSHELLLYESVGARLVPAGVDGEPPVLSCSVKDIQAVTEALEMMERGEAIPELS